MLRYSASLCVLALVAARALAAEPNDGQPAAATGKRAIPLPGEIDEIVCAGKGDFLLVRMNVLLRVAVFDMKQERIVGYLSFENEDSLLAGMAETALVVEPKKRTVTRWSLNPPQLQKTVTLKIKGDIQALAAGYAATKPPLLVTTEGPIFLDPATLNPIKATGDAEPTLPSRERRDPPFAAASADGSIYAGFEPLGDSDGLKTLRLQGSKLVFNQTFDRGYLPLPSPDGSTIFTQDGIFSAELKRLDKRDAKPRPCPFPTLHPAYYLGVQSDEGQAGGSSAGIYSTRDRSLLFNIGKLPGAPAFGRINGRDELAEYYYRRVVVHPALKKLFFATTYEKALDVFPLELPATPKPAAEK